MKIIVSHPTGNQNVRAALNGFHEAKMLAAFITSIASFKNGLLDKISIGLLEELRRRQFDDSLKPLTTCYPYKESGRLLFSKFGINKFLKHEIGSFSVDAVYDFIDRKTAAYIKVKKGRFDAIYAYEDGAACSFAVGKQNGIQCLYDLPIGYWKAARKILADEQEKWPEWAVTLTGFRDSRAKLERKDKELMLADRIYVASTFTAQTLNEFDGQLAPVEVIPYGFPAIVGQRVYTSPLNRRLRFLFVGGLSQRKGLANLFAAFNKFEKDAELTIIGRAIGENCSALQTALKKHTWIPSMPHHEILRTMREHDVLVFPSLFEGFGLVITEAMSQGTPVITTTRTAGKDFIENSVNGWLVEPGSTKALEDVFDNIISNPSVIEKAGIEAMRTAKERSWSVYGRELVASVSGAVIQK